MTKVEIPKDPSNEARAFLLLEKAGLIRLKPGASINTTPLDIVTNPKHLCFIELDAAQLPHSLTDVSLTAINMNFLIPGAYHPFARCTIYRGP